MTVRSTSGDLPTAEPSGDRAARQLAAMRLLFDADRDRHQADVLLATVFEALADGATRTTDELLRQVETDWPGIVIARERLESALEIAEQRGLLTANTTLGNTTTWSISGTAVLGVNDSKVWARSVLDRCRAQVEDRAHEQGMAVSREQADHWTNVLLEVLHEGMIASFRCHQHDIREVAGRLFPPYDRSAIIEATRRRIDDQATAEFLAALALAALDPGSTFGTEVVHYLATGYILHALMVGYDVAAERSELSDFAGEVLILDTPVLLRLLSGGKAFRWTSDLVGRIARQAGAVVAVTSRTRRELTDMLQRRDGDARKIERELADTVPRANLAAVAPDEVLAIWLDEPSAPTWQEFKESATTLLTTLKALGVNVDYEPDGYTCDASIRQRFADSVQQITGERGKRRHDVPAAHDGELLCVASYLRAQRKTSDPGRIWSGACIVTTDRSLDTAYRVVDGNDKPTIALTISQTASLLARLAQPGDAERLAELIATDLQWQIKFQRATSFGVDQAIELARSFTAKDHDALLVQASTAELTFESLLAEVDYAGDPTKAARAAIIHQERRRREAHKVQHEEHEAERIRDRERAAAEKARADALTNELESSRRREAEHGASNADLKARNTVLRRTIVVVVLYFVAALLLVGAVALDVFSWPTVVAPAAGMAATSKWLYDWIRDPDQRLIGVVLSAIAWAALGLLGGLLFG